MAMPADLRAHRSECERVLPADHLVPDPDFVIDNGISIAAPPSIVWPWLKQMGSGRAGWYAYDFVDNDGRPSATSLIRELQDINVGDVMPSLPGAADSFVVARVEEDRDLVLTIPGGDNGPGLSWEFFLEPSASNGTRLLVRGRVGKNWPGSSGAVPPTAGRKRPIEYVYAVLARIPRSVMVPVALTGHHAMQARQLRGIKRRSEETAGNGEETAGNGADARRTRWALWTAAAGCLGALGYGALKAIWALGGTIGVDDPAQLRASGTSDSLWLLANMGTVALAVFAALILVALVLPVDTVARHPITRTLGWLGTVMVIPGALGLAATLDYVAGSHLFGGTKLGGISPGTYIFVYVCFLMLGLAFASTTFLTRRGPVRRTARLQKDETAATRGN